MDGADAPALFSGSRESGWAALPARPSALRRNPAFQDRVFHFVTALQVRLTARCGPSGRFLPPTPPLGGRLRQFWSDGGGYVA